MLFLQQKEVFFLEQYIKLLSSSRLFAGISENDIIPMLKCLKAEKENFSKGEYIFRSGDKIKSAAFLLSGKAVIQKEDYWGNLSIINVILPGNLFGEAFAVPDSPDFTGNAIADEKSDVLFMDFSRLMTTCSSACAFHHTAVINMFSVTAEKNRLLTQKIEHMSQRTTRAKLLSYLSACSVQSASSSFDIPLNRQQLADYLSVDRSAMSSELSKMQSDGIIEYNKNHFTLK